eukprot:scaffold22127_cov63-Attheya_sp.AAC.1
MDGPAPALDQDQAPFPRSFPKIRCRSGNSRDTRRYAWIACDPLRQTSGPECRETKLAPGPTSDRHTALQTNGLPHTVRT